ncbi:MAG TPA: phosphate signaling complex protein PhoU [Thermomicrobiaceae bacterium]|nr:phosphate signaling complex protein PhoU [Thermomicrobiaceae bacterium]
MTDRPSSRTHYDRQLAQLGNELIMLGGTVEHAVARAVEALRQRDAAAARAVIIADRAIDDRVYQLEEQALRLIATQQPLATDLRVVAATLFIMTELERIGDYAEGIAKITLQVAEEAPLKPLIDIPRMAEIVAEMLHDSLSAFIDRDLERCEAIWLRDDDVDALYDQVFRELLTYMLANPATVEPATRLIWAAHNLERIADRVTNICERTAFVITGNPRQLTRRSIADARADRSGNYLIDPGTAGG